MNKLLTVLIAGLFAVSVNVFAADAAKPVDAAKPAAEAAAPVAAATDAVKAEKPADAKVAKKHAKKALKKEAAGK